MPRLFTGFEIPVAVTEALSSLRGGLVGARWIDPANYHLTLRFLGDVDGPTARDAAAILAEGRTRSPVRITLESLSTFGGTRPRAIIVRAVPSPELVQLQAEQERALRRVGLAPETRKFTPHVTLARLRDASSGDVAACLATRGHVPPITFTAERFVLYSARDSVGGGPYLVEAEYPLEGPPAVAGSPWRSVEPAAWAAFRRSA